MTAAAASRPPGVDAVLRCSALDEARSMVRHDVLVALIRRALSESMKDSDSEASLDSVAATVVRDVDQLLHPAPRKVINATGAILHTNLGRAPLSADAVTAIMAASGYADLELDLSQGKRTSRQVVLESLFNVLIGVEASFVVVNNAAALLLALRALAGKKEIIVSRGQLVEIGDGFRLPAIIRESGARLREVGTTNRTVIDDYREAVGTRTAAFLHVHTSNFRQIGFVATPGIRELAHAAHESGILLIADNGSGATVDTTDFGLEHEPTPAEAAAAGADVVTFSTDKLFGGPQAGVIATRGELMERIRRHPLARALRPDKTIVAALAATARQYIRNDWATIPVHRLLATEPDALRVRTEAIATAVRLRGWTFVARPSEAVVGGGSLPSQTLPSWTVEIRGQRITRFAESLRTAEVPIVGRVSRGSLALDLRAVDPADDVIIVSTLKKCLAALDGARRF